MLPSLWQMSCPLVRELLKKYLPVATVDEYVGWIFAEDIGFREKKEQEVFFFFLEKELQSICILWSRSLSIVISLFLFYNEDMKMAICFKRRSLLFSVLRFILFLKWRRLFVLSLHRHTVLFFFQSVRIWN